MHDAATTKFNSKDTKQEVNIFGHIIIRLGISLTLLTGLAACAQSSPSEHYRAAEEAYNRSAFKEARVHLANALADDSNKPQYNLLLAKLMLSLGDGIAAQSALKKLDKDKLAAVDRHIMASHAYILRDQPDKAIEEIDKIAKAQWTDQAYRMKIWAYLVMGTINDHFTLVDEALEKFPNNADLLVLNGEYALFRRDQYDAEQQAKAAIKINPNHYGALMLRGQSALLDEELKIARKYFAMASKIRPENAVPLTHIASIDLDGGYLENAEKLIGTASTKQDKLPLLILQKARLAYLRDNLEKARNILQDEKNSLDSFAAAAFLSGKIAFQLGNREFAITELNRALILNPDEQDAKLLLNAIKEGAAANESPK